MSCCQSGLEIYPTWRETVTVVKVFSEEIIRVITKPPIYTSLHASFQWHQRKAEEALMVVVVAVVAAAGAVVVMMTTVTTITVTTTMIMTTMIIIVAVEVAIAMITIMIMVVVDQTIHTIPLSVWPVTGGR